MPKQVIAVSEETYARLEELRKQHGQESIADIVKRLAGSHDPGELAAYKRLTPRLRQLLRLLAEGHGTKDIAAQLNISVKTVEFHRSRLTTELGMRAVALLARFAVRVGAVLP